MNNGEVTNLRHLLRRALVDAGFTIHDCATQNPSGGVCLTPLAPGADPAGVGVIVSWTTHDRLGKDETRYYAYQAVLNAMNDTLAFVVPELGFAVRPFGDAGAIMVTGPSLQHADAPVPDSPDLLGP